MGIPLQERLSALHLSRLPVWVYDHEQGRFRWANARAAEVWRAETTDELLARDFSGITEGTRIRLDNYMNALRQGREVAEDWTLYPRGQPTTMTLHGSAITLDDGRLAILFQALSREGHIEASTVRGVEALRHASLLVSLVTPGGQTLFHNPAALRSFGDVPTIDGWFEDVQGLLARSTGEVFDGELLARTLQGERWHAVEARSTVDPVSGEPAVLLLQLDVSKRREAEDLAESQSRAVDELNTSLRLVEEQRRQILMLSAPILEVGKRMLAVALIGALGAERFDEISERLLPRIQDHRTRFIILDFTGCHGLLDGGSGGLDRLLGAIRLLGAQPILTGIGPTLARALGEAGADLSHATVLRTLREGIDHGRAHLTP